MVFRVSQDWFSGFNHARRGFALNNHLSELRGGMNRTRVATTIEQVQEFLQGEGHYLLSSDSLQAYVSRTRLLLDKAHAPGELLYVGILGGTGVGKSMLINALARQKISDSSDRRPFTDRAVVYRHQDTHRGLEKLASLIREPDAVHEIDTIKDLVLLDLPDFDSTEETNRRAVLEIIPELDAIVWVVSPEKYADAVFYELVGRTTMHKDSFTFVFNKADELIEEGKTDRHSRLKEVLGDLTFRLKHEARIEQPRIFSLSAAYEFRGTTGNPALENEFQRFRDFLMARRDAKEIASIKTVNLIEETRQVMNELNEIVRPDDKNRILNSIREMHSTPARADEVAGLEMLGEERGLTVSIMRYLAHNDGSVASVKWAVRWLTPRRWAGLISSEASLEEAFDRVARALEKSRRASVEKIMAQTGSELLLAFEGTARPMNDRQPEQLIQRAVDKASKTFVHEVEGRKRALSGSVARWRRMMQKLVLFVPVPILILKLAGPMRIEAWLDNPGPANSAKILLGIAASLFSSDGLIGLAVLGICEIMLVYWLAVRRIKKIERSAEQTARDAIGYLSENLDSLVQQVRGEQEDSLMRVQKGIDRFASLKSAFQPLQDHASADNLM